MKPLDPEKLPLRGTAVIEASAGTGKTYTITSLFVRLLLEQELTVEQILVVTYTRAATAELRDRIRKRVTSLLAIARGEHSDDVQLARFAASAMERRGRGPVLRDLERAIGSLDEAPVLTIHGFCQRVLSEHAFESGASFESELTTHAAPLLDEIADDFFTRELFEAPLDHAQVLLEEPPILRRMAARLGGRGLRVVPETIAAREGDRAAFERALAEAQALFARDRSAIVDQIADLRGFGEKTAARSANTLAASLARGDAVALAASKLGNVARGVSKTRGRPPEHPFFHALDALLLAAREMSDAQETLTLAFRRRFVDYLESELAKRTEIRNVRTFDALLTDLDRALASAHGPLLRMRLQKKYRAALVDEFQDTDPVQYRIFRRLFGESATPLLLIGDPKQAIYGFRGADVAAYLDARAEAGDEVYTLDVNHRSDPSLVAALNERYARVELPFLTPAISYLSVRAASPRDRLESRDGRAPIDLALFEGRGLGNDLLRRGIARAVAGDIAALLASGVTVRDGTRIAPLAARDVAVLTRTNAEAALVQAALRDAGVPSVLAGDASVFDSEDAPELERALLAMAHPADARALRSFLASRYGGYDAEALLALEADDAAWEAQRECMQSVHEVWVGRGFMQALRALAESYELERKLLSRADGMRRITNLWHLGELLAEAAQRERLGPLGVLRWFARVQEDQTMRSELSGEEHELRLESGEDAVTLTTVHKSKGLEYPVVYCPFSWDAAKLHRGDKELVRFHDPEARGALSVDLGSAHKKEHEAIAEREALAEALRLLYVALTRAKHRVTLVIPEIDKFAESALAYTLFGGGDAEAVKARVSRALSTATLFSELGRESEPRGTSVRRLEPQSAPPYGRPAQTFVGARPLRRELDASYRVASFSALIARERTPLAEAGLDRDAVEPAADGSHERVELPSTLALAPFPRGTVAGQLVHEALEHADFAASREELVVLSERLVRARGYAVELAESLATGLVQALATPLDDQGLRLCDVPKSARLDEMEFVFPVDSMLTPRLLERSFRLHGAPAALPSYASDLRELGFDALHGYLRGFVDLVFRHRDRYYIVDYKSNWLGPRPEDYTGPALVQSMAHHHYFLQYHLYTVALHRYLKQRLRGYDYDRAFGGVYYLFLRGMAPEHAAGTAVFYDLPPRSLIEELDRALSADKAAEGALP